MTASALTAGCSRSAWRRSPWSRPPTAGPTATAVGTAATDSAVTLGATNLSPDRLQVQAVIGRDEISTFTGLMGDVEMVLRDAIADGLDRRAVAEMFTAGTAPTTSSTVVTYAPGLAAVTAALDGRYAGSCKDLAVLVGPETGRLFETLYRSDESEVTLAMRLMDACEAYRISANVAAAAKRRPGDARRPRRRRSRRRRGK